MKDMALNWHSIMALNDGTHQSFIGGMGDSRQGWLFRGHSVPVNAMLSEIFLQPHIDEKTERGIPVISFEYGEGAFDFSDNDITVAAPFNFINGVGNKVGNKTEENGLNDSQTKVLVEIRNNPNITKKELAIVCCLGKTSIDNAIVVLKKEGIHRKSRFK